MCFLYGQFFACTDDSFLYLFHTLYPKFCQRINIVRAADTTRGTSKEGGERGELCLWQRKRDARVAAVKIGSDKQERMPILGSAAGERSEHFADQLQTKEGVAL